MARTTDGPTRPDAGGGKIGLEGAGQRDVDWPEVLRALIRMGEHLSSDADLSERMRLLCSEATTLLGCDRTSICLWDGAFYRPAYSSEGSPELWEPFASLGIPADAPLIAEMEASETFVAINDTASHLGFRRLADLARVNSIVLAPMVSDEGERLGFLSAAFDEPMGAFDDYRAEIVVGVARLAHGAVINDQVRSSRRVADLERVAMLVKLVGAEDEERRRLARELHDDPIQRLFALQLRLETAAEASGPLEQPEIERLVVDAIAATNSLRSLLTDLHPTAVDGRTLGAALGLALDRRAGPAGWVTSVTDANTTQPPAANLTVLFRIALQAVQNAATHASASEVTIHLRTVDEGSEVKVRDNGCGFDPMTVSDDRFGLTSMAERATGAGGHFSVDSQTGGGTQVTAWLPNRE